MPPPQYIRESIGWLRRPRTKGAATSGGAFIFTTRRPRNSRPFSLPSSLLLPDPAFGWRGLSCPFSLFLPLSVLFPLFHDTYEYKILRQVALFLSLFPSLCFVCESNDLRRPMSRYALREKCTSYLRPTKKNCAMVVVSYIMKR